MFDPATPVAADDIVALTHPGRARVPVTDPVAAPADVDGVHFESLAYTPPARPADRLRDVVRRLRGPRSGESLVWSLTFPDGTRLLHLDLALHRATDEGWVQRAAARFGNADWTILGVPYGEGDALERWLPRFGPNRVLLTELLNDERREAGLPTELVTPTRDRLVAQGLDVHVFATQTSFRFE